MRCIQIVRSVLLSNLIVFASGQAAISQVSWPSIADIQTRGVEVSQQDLRQALSDRTALLSPGPGASGLGAIFRCTEGASPILYFGSPQSGLEVGKCRVEASKICLMSPSQQKELCYEIRRLEEYEELLFGSRVSASDTQTNPNQPAMSLALVPTDVYGLAAASGTLDFGSATITLSPSYRFTLANASGFPLRFIFQGEANYEALVLFVDQIGWPDQTTAPHVQLDQPLQRQPQVDFLKTWEQQYSKRDLQGWGYQEGFKSIGYQASEVEVDGSPCVKTHESIYANEDPAQNDTTYMVEHVSQQVCIALNTGTFLALTAKFIEPLEISSEQAEARAETIFATLHLLTAAEGGVGEEITFEILQEMQGGYPDLTWEMLDCVQGWNRAAQVNGCNHAIRRYAEVINSGEWLLANDGLTGTERKVVQKTVRDSQSTLAILHTVRASLLLEEAPKQSSEDCETAKKIAAVLEDDELIQIASECP